MTTINQEKTLLTNITRSIQSELSTEEIIALTAIFNKLHKMYPKEIHFTIGRATDNNGLGTNVWYIIDEYQHNLFGTMMFPSDY